VGFIGLTLKGTPQLVAANGISDLTFNDEIETINSNAKSLKSSGVQAVVVLIHQGGVSTATAVNDQTCPVSFGDLGSILDGISADVDVVVSGHSHQEYVCKVTGKASKKEYLVTQTGFYGEAITDINLKIHPQNGVTSKSANTVPVIQTDNNTGVTIPPAFRTFSKDATIDTLVTNYVNKSKTLGETKVGTINATIPIAFFGNTTGRDESAEGRLGEVVADAYLYGVPGGADFAVTNPGGLRASLSCAVGAIPPCPVKYSDLQTAMPYSNTLVKVSLTGSQIIRLLEQQWEAPNCTAKYNPDTSQYGRWLQVSKELTYSFDNNVNAWTSGAMPANCAAAGTGNRVKPETVKINSASLDLNKTYTVLTNSFLAGGGDNFTIFKFGTNVIDTKIIDTNAVIDYFKDNSPVAVPTPRITRVN
jgi:5'-nucleotidase